jgi:hypothetical protein
VAQAVLAMTVTKFSWRTTSVEQAVLAMTTGLWHGDVTHEVGIASLHTCADTFLFW